MSKRKPQRARQPQQPDSLARTLRNVTDAGKPVTHKGLTMDMLVNEYARLGTDDNLLAANRYQMNRLTQQYALMDSLYRGDWIANRIITTIPEDMIKNWFKLVCQVEPDQTDVLERLIRQTHIRERLREGLRWGRLYGGAAAVMMIKGQEDMLDQPLDLEMMMPGDFKGLIVSDRWNGVYPSPELVDDIDDPDFGLPEYYTFAMSETDVMNGVRVHHSRILRFTGRELPYIEKMAESYWGMSEIEHVYAELNKRNSASANIAQLIFIAHLRVFKMEDLGQTLALGDIFTQNDLYNVLSAQNYLMNNMSLQVMSKDDDFQTFDYTFSGLADVYEQFMMDIAGASEIPATKLFGRAPQGMNATGEGDLRNYYDTVRQNQETHLRPVLEKLLPVLCVSAWGAVPDDLDFEFNPIRDTSDEERAGLIQQTANAINSVFNSGIISQKTALQELRQSGTEYGMWTNITDEDIDNADDEAAPQGEGEEGERMMPGGGDMPPEMMGGEADEQNAGQDPQGDVREQGAPGESDEGGDQQPGQRGQSSGKNAARDGQSWWSRVFGRGRRSGER